MKSINNGNSKKNKSTDETNIYYFWDDSLDPDKITDVDNIIWAPYELEIQESLRKGYKKYTETNYSSAFEEKDLNLEPPLNYKVNFKLSLQINKNDITKIRSVLRISKDNIMLVKRKNRFSNKKEIDIQVLKLINQPIFNNNKLKYNIVDTSNKSIIDLNKDKNKSISVNSLKKDNFKLSYELFNLQNIYQATTDKKNVFEYNFNFIENVSVKIYLHQGVYKETINDLKSLQDLKTKIIKEIDFLGILLSKPKSLLKYRIKIEEMSNNFFKEFINLFTIDGFLFNEVNKILISDKIEEFKTIKYTYLAFSAAFKYLCSTLNKEFIENMYKTENNKKFLENSNDCNFKSQSNNFSIDSNEIMNNNKDDLFVYAYINYGSKDLEVFHNSSIDNGEFELLKFYGFLPTTRNKQVLQPFFDFKNGNKVEILLRIKIPEYIIKQESENFLCLESISEFANEREILLKDNSVILVNEIKNYGSFKNKFIKECTLITFTQRSYLNLLSFPQMKQSQDRLELSDNRAFLDDCTNRIFLIKNFFEEDRQVKYLNLSHNNIGILTNNKYEDINSNIQVEPSTTEVNNDINNLISNNFAIFLLLKELFFKSKFNLISLNLAYNNLNNNVQNLIIIKDIVLNSENLKELFLGGNYLGKNTENMVIIKDMLLSKNPLDHLDLSRNNFDENEENILLLKEALIENPRLKEINLSNNNLGLNITLMKILKEIFLENNNLRMLNISYNKLGTNIHNAVILKEMINISSNLEKICLFKNNFTIEIENEIRTLSNVLETLKVFI